MSDNTAPLINNKSSEFDIEAIRMDFPILSQQIHGKPLVYLDNGATSQKPSSVIETIDHYYGDYNSNVHRGVHSLSEKATIAYEGSREKVKEFINTASTKEVIYVKGTTEAINLVAHSWGRDNISEGDEIIISAMEHHSNIVPWQLLCQQTGAQLKVIPINDSGELEMDEFDALLTDKTKLVSIVHISNALGTIIPVKTICQKAHAAGAIVMLDGAQAAPHQKVDVQDLDCDFYAFSSHKIFGPTGVGVLYGKEYLLEAMSPYQTGGDMIKMVSFEKTLFNDLPYKFEAGTPNIEGVIGMGAAIDYMNSVGIDNILSYENELLEYANDALTTIEGLRIIGTAKHKASLISFVLGDIHPHDLGTILDHEGVAIRAGHHCAMPVMERFDVPATVRASMAFYNNTNDIDVLVRGIENAKKVFA
jgi:cysteine desulfurase/selenocysteine lyase